MAVSSINTTRDPPTIVSSTRSPIAAGDPLAATGFSGDIDLNTSNDEIDPSWNVQGVTRLAITAKLRSGTWGTANAIVRGSIDGSNWTTITTLTAVGTTRKIDVADYQFVQVRTSLVEGASGVAEFAAYGYSPPFDWVGPVESHATLAAVVTEHVFPVGIEGLLTLVTKTSGYTILTSDEVIICDAEAGSFTLTLPAVSGTQGKRYYIKKIDSTANTVTVDGNSSDTVDDGATAVLTDQYESVTIVSDDTEWFIL